MGNVIWFDASQILPCTPSASSEAADSPAARMGIVGGRFERPWRATGTGGQTLSFPTGGSSVAFALYNANFAEITIAGAPYTISQDFDGRGKLFVVASASGTVSVSIAGGQTTTDGATAYKIGRLFFLTAYNTLEQNPESLTKEIHDPQLLVDSELGVYDTLPAGSPYATEAWSGKWISDALPNIKALFQRRSHAWVGLFRNYLDRDYELTFYHKIGGARLTYGQFAIDMETNFRQAC